MRRKLGESKEVRSEVKGDEGRHAKAVYSQSKKKEKPHGGSETHRSRVGENKTRIRQGMPDVTAFNMMRQPFNAHRL